ncbi:cyclic nucleotide-binding domain-containing protein [Leptolyngbya ohadii]|uniref:cyclic nucleotide-binding domain-containing protein n=1 Tax=Leptolyngbya ohadii TaxID=1962290 RepID=UPI000B59A1F6|nr:cyclic nucleotide-binding domain-containing protein [Leptolyngbya ohadii]
MEKRTYAPGDVVYQEGDTSESVYLIKSGRIELVDHYPETGDVVSKTLGAGRVFGEIELIDRKARSSTAKVTESSKLLVFSHEEILDILFKHPEQSLVLARDVFDRLRQLYSTDSLDAEMTKLREEMHETIKKAVVSHESRVVKSHNGMAAIAIPIVLLVAIVVGIRLYLH